MSSGQCLLADVFHNKALYLSSDTSDSRRFGYIVFAFALLRVEPRVVSLSHNSLCKTTVSVPIPVILVG